MPLLTPSLSEDVESRHSNATWRGEKNADNCALNAPEFRSLAAWLNWS